MNEDYGIDSYYEDSFGNDDYNAWEENQVWLDSVYDDEEDEEDEEGDDYPE